MGSLYFVMHVFYGPNVLFFEPQWLLLHQSYIRLIFSPDFCADSFRCNRMRFVVALYSQAFPTNIKSA